MTSNAETWIRASYEVQTNNVNTLAVNQRNWQSQADGVVGRIADNQTRRFFKKYIWRAGKLFWVKGQIGVGYPRTLDQWRLTDRENVDEHNLKMNCWESIFYVAYQADIMSKDKIRAWESTTGTDDFRLRQLFGTRWPATGMGEIPPGHLITFLDHTSNTINHVAVSAGRLNNEDIIVHNLKLNQATTGLEQGGCIHFERLADCVGRYLGGATAYQTAPFWEAQALTHRYFKAL
jgi:hypothetical protein